MVPEVIRGGPVNRELMAHLMRLFPKPGWFVEAGAHNGIGASQTLWLEDMGWHGLCIEPSMSGLALAENRKCSVDTGCLHGYNGTVSWQEMEGDYRELSGVADSFYDHWQRKDKPHYHTKKVCVTLHRMLKEHGMPVTIDFLCLDTEGTEPDILRGHDFSLYSFSSIWVEYNDVAKRRTTLEELLLPKGYTRVMDTSHDLLFVKEGLLC